MSCDLLPTESPGPHFQGDVRDILGNGFDLMIAHPPCTYLTVSSAWAFKDGSIIDGVFREGVYHQKLKPGTLTGANRRAARAESVEFAKMLYDCPIPLVALENPVGNLSTLWRKPTQIIHPHQFGHDASKITCLWLKGLPPLVPTNVVTRPKGERYSNQSPGGQNNLPPSDDRQKKRSETYLGIADAMAVQWG